MNTRWDLAWIVYNVSIHVLRRRWNSYTKIISEIHALWFDALKTIISTLFGKSFIYCSIEMNQCVDWTDQRWLRDIIELKNEITWISVNHFEKNILKAEMKLTTCYVGLQFFAKAKQEIITYLTLNCNVSHRMDQHEFRKKLGNTFCEFSKTNRFLRYSSQ